MPEGAEVRTNTDQLRALIKGKTLLEVRALSGKLLREGIKGNLALPQRVTDVGCKGKLIYIDLADGSRISSTLGMSGWWYPSKPPAPDQLSYLAGKGMTASAPLYLKELKHARVALITDEGVAAYYCDMRNFGNMKSWSKFEAHVPLDKVGVDLLQLSSMILMSEVAKVRELDSLCTHIDKSSYAKKPLAELLLAQEVIAGLGNIYRAETLFLSKINPFTSWNELSEPDKRKLLENACIILNIAYFTKGIMFYPASLLTKNGHLASGDVRGSHLVYGQRQTPMGQEVKSVAFQGRTLWHV